MACNYCNHITNADCVNKALETLRTHFSICQKTINDKDSQIEKLVSRNNRLMNAVEILQREKSDYLKENSYKKRKVTRSQYNSYNSVRQSILDGENKKKPLTLLQPTNDENKLPAFNKVDNINSIKSNKMVKQQLISMKTLNETSSKSNAIGNNSAFISHQKKSDTTSKQPGLKWVKKSQNRFREPDVVFCDEIIDASPNTSIKLKQTNSISKLRLRTDNKDTSRLKCGDDKVFNFTNPNTSCKVLSVTENTENDKFAFSSNKDSSVIVLQPELEVIDVDDNTENTQLASIQLLQDLMKFDNEHFAKELKNKSISKNQKAAEINERKDKKTTEEVKVCKMMEKSPDIATHFKQENITHLEQPAFTDCVTSDDDEDDFKIKPNPIKEKPLPGEMKTATINIKERFNIDCNDCQKFVNFRGHAMNERELEKLIRNCIHHKKHRPPLPLTPEGFWNPLMVSFDEDDPRNEVLIDTRFVDKKK